MTDKDATKKWAGKYDSPEAMEQGLLNLIPAFEQIKEEKKATEALLNQLHEQNTLLQEVVTKMPQPAPVPSPDYEDDPRKYIDSKMAQVIRAMELVPKMVQAEISEAMQPRAKAEAAKLDYMAGNPDFDEPSIQRFLSVNPSINRTYQRLLSNPDSAEQAFTYAHTLFKAQGGATKSTSVDQSAKNAATAPKASPAPTDIPGEDIDREASLKKKSNRAQSSFDVNDELSYAREFFNGSKFLEQIDKMRPDWAPE